MSSLPFANLPTSQPQAPQGNQSRGQQNRHRKGKGKGKKQHRNQNKSQSTGQAGPSTPKQKFACFLAGKCAPGVNACVVNTTAPSFASAQMEIVTQDPPIVHLEPHWFRVFDNEQEANELRQKYSQPGGITPNLLELINRRLQMLTRGGYVMSIMAATIPTKDGFGLGVLVTRRTSRGLQPFFKSFHIKLDWANYSQDRPKEVMALGALQAIIRLIIVPAGQAKQIANDTPIAISLDNSWVINCLEFKHKEWDMSTAYWRKRGTDIPVRLANDWYPLLTTFNKIPYPPGTQNPIVLSGCDFYNYQSFKGHGPRREANPLMLVPRALATIGATLAVNTEKMPILSEIQTTVAQLKQPVGQETPTVVVAPGTNNMMSMMTAFSGLNLATQAVQSPLQSNFPTTNTGYSGGPMRQY